jgi:hypothetical protein
MKFSSSLAVLSILVVHCVTFELKTRPVSNGFADIIKNVLNPKATLLIANYAQNKGVLDLINQSLKNQSFLCKILNKIPYVERNISRAIKYNLYAFEETNILIFNSTGQLKDLIAFNKIAQPASVYMNSLKIYVYCLGGKHKDLLWLGVNNVRKREKRGTSKSDIVDDMSDILANQYFLVNEEKSITLLTFVWYTQEACNKPQLIELNRFDKKTNKWENSNFSVEKFKDFHGCQLVFGVQNFYPEFQYNISIKPLKVSGYGKNVIGVFSERLNFTYRLNPIDGVKIFRRNYNYLYKNLTPDLHLSFVSGVPALSAHQIFYDFIDLNVPTVDYFAVPPPVPFDAYEKLHLPFDLATWIWTLIVFAAAFLTILIVYRMKIEVQNIVFGANVTTPSLNVVAQFCGISQVIMPRKNFARFLVMSFILYSFMIRTLYQGFMCDNLQSDLRRLKSIQSIADINLKELEYYVDGRIAEDENDTRFTKYLTEGLK